MNPHRDANDSREPGSRPHQRPRRYFGGSATFAARRMKCAVVPLVCFVPPPRPINFLSRASQRIPSPLVTIRCRRPIATSR